MANTKSPLFHKPVSQEYAKERNRSEKFPSKFPKKKAIHQVTTGLFAAWCVSVRAWDHGSMWAHVSVKMCGHVRLQKGMCKTARARVRACDSV